MRRTKEDAEKTRQDILEAAVNIFAEKGVAQSTLDEIAKAAGVTRGAVYWHFENKTQIFEALHDRLHHPFVSLILEDLKKDHPEPMVQLRDLCIKLLTDLEQDDYKRKALTLFVIKCNYSGELADYKTKHSEIKKENTKLFERYFEKAKKLGKIDSTEDSPLLAQSIMCYMKGILVEYLDRPEDFDIKTKAPKLIDLFFNNLTSR